MTIFTTNRYIAFVKISPAAIYVETFTILFIVPISVEVKDKNSIA